MKRRGHKTRSHSKKNFNCPLIARYILGTYLIFFGLNKFLNLITPGPGPASAQAFYAAMNNTGYFIPFLGITFLVVGTLLLSNRFVPLALIILAPISINVLLFHLFLDPSAIAGGLILAILNIYLGIKNIDAYRPLLK